MNSRTAGAVDMRRSTLINGFVISFVVLALLVGCARPRDPDVVPGAMPDPTTDTAPAKTRVIAYINVASGCQVPTVELVNSLAAEHSDIATLEMVDFGSPDGEKRWYGDGMDCMGLLFDGSPVLRFPGADGESRTVAFLMPAGFGWTHEDLELAFAALRAGTAEILDEAEARRDLAPKLLTVAWDARAVDGQAELRLNGNPLFVVQVAADGKTPLERAQAARDALEAWTDEPVHPSQLSVARETDEAFRVTARGSDVIGMTAEDVAAAGLDTPQDLAEEWVNSIKSGIVAAARDTRAVTD